MKISGTGAIVSGGASGLGEATVRMLAGQGAQVVIADLNENRGRELAEELGATVRFVRTDVSDADSVAAAIAAVKEFGTDLRILVNCAGIAVAERILGKEGHHDLARFAKVMQINLVGSFVLMTLAAETMTQNAPDAAGERGVMVNTASVAAFDGQIGQVAYAASKGGIVSMTLPAARELARHGIRVMAIAPGLFNTPMLAGLPEAARESLGQQVPFPSRLGHPAEYAALAQHIIENTMLNGEVIRLDGAIRMAPK
jgi:NAD(P)-dependent dehydrogenase (short-subunit alcohol dehydrogenase family)